MIKITDGFVIGMVIMAALAMAIAGALNVIAAHKRRSRRRIIAARIRARFGSRVP